MPNFTRAQIPPPKDWDEFEDLCCDLWSRIYQDKNTQKNGRTGQAQYGVDISGQIDGTERYFAVQCKGKDTRYGSELTVNELDREVENAKKFKPKLTEFVLATTAANDAKIQSHARKISFELKKDGYFRVSVKSWDEIHRHLGDYPELIKKYYPDYSSENDEVLKIVRELKAKSDAQVINNKNGLHIQKEGTNRQRVIQAVDLETNDRLITKLNENLNSEIDGYRDLINIGNNTSAKDLLIRLKERGWDSFDNYIKFRIITNIAACDLNLGNYDAASKGFRDAKRLEVSNEKAISNYILSYIIVGDNIAASNAARNAIKEFPENITIKYLLLISTDSAIDLDSFITHQDRKDSKIIVGLSIYYRNMGDISKSKKLIKESYKDFKECDEFSLYYAVDALEDICQKITYVSPDLFTESQNRIISECHAILDRLYQKVMSSDSFLNFNAIITNYILCLRLRGKSQEAKKITEKVLESKSDDEYKYILVQIFIDLERWSDAEETLSSMNIHNSHEYSSLALTIYFHNKKYKTLLSQIECMKSELSDISFAYGYKVLCLYKEYGFTYSKEYFENIRRDEEFDVLTHIAYSRVLNEEGQTVKSINILDEAFNQIGEGDFNSTLRLAEEYCKHLMFDKSLELYKRLDISFDFDSELIRALIITATNADDRYYLSTIYQKLDFHYIDIPFYEEYYTYYLLLTGDFEKAEPLLKQLLSKYPNNLSVAINYISMLYRANRKGEVQGVLSKIEIDEYQTGNDRMLICNFYVDIEQFDKALELAFDTRLRYAHDADVHASYVSILATGKLSTYIKPPKTVSNNTAVTLKGSDVKTYYISNDPDITLKEKISTAHPLSKQLIGKRLGETVDVKINNYNSVSYEVHDISNKYHFLLKETIDNFYRRFPESEKLFSIGVKVDDNSDYDFSKLKEFLALRSKAYTDTLEKYKEHPLSIGVVSNQLSVNPLCLWIDLLSDPKSEIYMCLGSTEERNNAFGLIEGKKRYIIDILTLYNIFNFKLYNKLKSIIGTFYTTQSSVDTLLHFISQLDSKLDEGKKGGLGLSNGELIFHEKSAANISSDLSHFQDFKNWLLNNIKVIPAISDRPGDKALKFYVDNLGNSFKDCVLASANTDCLLFSDDYRLRQVAELAYQVDTVWSQPIMQYAAKSNMIDYKAYNEYVYGYMKHGFKFTSIDPKVLLTATQILDDKYWEQFLLFCSSLGKDGINIETAVKVADQYMRSSVSNRDNISSISKYVYAVLNGITNNFCHPYSGEIINLLYSMYIELNLEKLSYLIHQWAKGHFFDIQLE